MERLLIVVPHNYCEDKKKKRHCDLIASDILNKVRDYTKNISICVHVADELRSSSDNNKFDINSKIWRQNLIKKINRFSPDFIMEIHSFPGKHPAYNSDNNNYERFSMGTPWNGADLVIFKSKYNKHFVKKLRQMIKEKVPNSKVLICSPIHDVAITDHAGESAIPHTLFEFNEDKLDKNNELTHAIISSINDLIKSKYIRKKIFNYYISIILLIIVLIIIFMPSFFSFDVGLRHRTI